MGVLVNLMGDGGGMKMLQESVPGTRVSTDFGKNTRTSLAFSCKGIDESKLETETELNTG